jgi:hypothetical protein
MNAMIFQDSNGKYPRKGGVVMYTADESLWKVVSIAETTEKTEDRKYNFRKAELRELDWGEAERYRRNGKRYENFIYWL